MRSGGWFGTSGHLKSPPRGRGCQSYHGLMGRKRVITKYFSNWPAPVMVVTFLYLYFQTHSKFFSSSWSCLGIQSENTEKTGTWWSDQHWILTVWSRAGQTKHSWEQDSERRGCRVGCLDWLLFSWKPLEPWPLGGTASPTIPPVISPKSSWCPPVTFSGEY